MYKRKEKKKKVPKYVVCKNVKEKNKKLMSHDPMKCRINKCVVMMGVCDAECR